ncbi:hypothetical protein AeMF1_005918 [Aphanomyces euteiches]|nr:hypothetical protein AeMF1_005918 [Aphanomyces euteiches]
MELPEIHVLSAAGKPILSTKTADECSNVSIAGLIQGISSFADDSLRQIKTSTHILSFLPSPPLLFFCATSSTFYGLNVSRLLLLLKHHLLVFLTQNGLSLIESNPNYDLRNLLYGTHDVLTAIAAAWTQQIWTQLDDIGVRFWPLAIEARRSIQNAIDVSGLVFGLVSCQGHIVSYKQGHKDHPFRVADVHLLLHVVDKMPSLKSSESWTPLCLPAFNASGFLYAYILFVLPNVNVILLSTDQTHFHPLQMHVQNTLKPVVLAVMDQMASRPPRRDLMPLRFQPLLLHYFFQSDRTHEYICPEFQDCPMLDSPEWRIQLLRTYCTLHTRLHGSLKDERKLGYPLDSSTLPKATVYFTRTETMVALGLVKPNGFLYVCCQPLLSAEQANDLADNLWLFIVQDLLTA